MTVSADTVLEARGISKAFPGVQALDDVSIVLRRGRLTALLGENGAGKSTLMNIVAGVLPPDSGEILLDGSPRQFANPREAREAGIAMIHQELNLIANLTVAENVFLGREPLNRLGFVDVARMHRATATLLDTLDLPVSPGTPLGRLRVGQQQVVEIAKALSTDARVMIMDEPTSAITEHEIEVLFGIVDKLKRQGVAIAYITHKLEELVRIGDDVVVGDDDAGFIHHEARAERLHLARLRRRAVLVLVEELVEEFLERRALGQFRPRDVAVAAADGLRGRDVDDGIDQLRRQVGDRCRPFLRMSRNGKPARYSQGGNGHRQRERRGARQSQEFRGQ